MKKLLPLVCLLLSTSIALPALAWDCNATGTWDITVYDANDNPPVYHKTMIITQPYDTINLTALTMESLENGTITYTGTVLPNGLMTMTSQPFHYPDALPTDIFVRYITFQLSSDWLSASGYVYQYLNGVIFGGAQERPIPLTMIRTSPYEINCAQTSGSGHPFTQQP